MMKIITLPNPILIKKSDPIDKVNNKVLDAEQIFKEVYRDFPSLEL